MPQKELYDVLSKLDVLLLFIAGCASFVKPLPAFRFYCFLAALRITLHSSPYGSNPLWEGPMIFCKILMTVEAFNMHTMFAGQREKFLLFQVCTVAALGCGFFVLLHNPQPYLSNQVLAATNRSIHAALALFCVLTLAYSWLTPWRFGWIGSRQICLLSLFFVALSTVQMWPVMSQPHYTNYYIINSTYLLVSCAIWLLWIQFLIGSRSNRDDQTRRGIPSRELDLSRELS